MAYVKEKIYRRVKQNWSSKFNNYLIILMTVNYLFAHEFNFGYTEIAQALSTSNGHEETKKYR